VHDVVRENVPLRWVSPARVAGTQDIEVRARVSGVVVERAYREGQPVAKGDLLFRIEPDAYRALVAQADAEVARQQALVAEAEQTFKRMSALVEDGAVSRSEFDAAEAALRSARANEAAAKAAADIARLDLSYTEVRAPANGFASREAVTLGNTVSGSRNAPGDLLTTIVQADQARVEFSIPEPSFLRARALVPERGRGLTATVTKGSDCAGEGKVDFTDTRVNQQTGTVQVRALFDNPTACLIPGQFVEVALSGAELPNAIVIPKHAVLFSQAGAVAWVIGADNTVAMRPVDLGESLEDRWVVERGLEAGERIVVGGLLKLRPGSAVVVAPPAAPAATEQER